MSACVLSIYTCAYICAYILHMFCIEYSTGMCIQSTLLSSCIHTLPIDHVLHNGVCAQCVQYSAVYTVYSFTCIPCFLCVSCICHIHQPTSLPSIVTRFLQTQDMDSRCYGQHGGVHSEGASVKFSALALC